MTRPASETEASAAPNGGSKAAPGDAEGAEAWKPAFRRAGEDAIGRSSLLSYIVFAWAGPLVHYCSKGLLRPADVFALPPDVTSRVRRTQRPEKPRNDDVIVTWPTQRRRFLLFASAS